MGHTYDDILKKYRTVYQKFMDYADDEMPDDEDLILIALRSDCEVMENRMKRDEMEMRLENMDTLDFQAAFLCGLDVEIVFADGHTELAQSEADIANLGGLVEFRIVEEE